MKNLPVTLVLSHL